MQRVSVMRKSVYILPLASDLVSKAFNYMPENELLYPDKFLPS